MKTLTESQSERLAKVTDKLPKGYTYELHVDDSGDFYGVSLCHESENEEIAYVSKAMLAHVKGGRSDEALQRLLINRAATALWHKQPDWGNEPVQR